MSRRGFGTRRATFRWIGVACAAAVLVCLLLELALRGFWPELLPAQVTGLFAPHPQLGHVLVPSRETVITSPEYTVTVRTNSDGFRGAALAPKSEGTIRILCLGDWLTFGEGVEDDQTYPVRVEAALRERYPGRDIQLVNAGIPGYGTLDELAYLKSLAPWLKPDFVIAQFYAGDDFAENLLPSRERQEIRDGMLVQTDRFIAVTGPRWLVLLNRAKRASHLVNQVSEHVGWVASRANLLIDLQQSSNTYFSDEEAQRTREQLSEIHAVADRFGASTLFVFSPDKMQVMSRPQTRLRAASLVAEVAEATGSGFIDLTPVLAEQDVELLYPRTNGTWKPAAYELAAQAVTNEIIALGWIDRTE